MQHMFLGGFGYYPRLLAMTTIAALASAVSPAHAGGNGWSGATQISPTLQPDPTRGSELNDVAVNASGLTIAAWDQYTYNNGGGSTIGAAVQSGGRWGAPMTISGMTGFSMTPQVAVGADGTMAVSWTYQDPVSDPANYPNPVQKIQVAVKPANATAWTTTTLNTGTIGGVAITQFVPVAVDAGGNVTAAWSFWNGTKHVIQTATRSAQTGSWSAPVNLSTSQDGFNVDGLTPVLAVNSFGEMAVAFAVSPYTPTAGSCDRSQPSLQGTCILYVHRDSAGTGPNNGWTWPVSVSEVLSSSVGYISSPQVALDAGGLATVIYRGQGIEVTQQLAAGSWTMPMSIIQINIPGASISNPDLAVDANGNAIAAVSVFDPTINVDRSSVWVARTTSPGNWGQAVRLTDPTVPVDAYAAKVALSPNGSLALVGWLDHYHGVAQVSRWTGTAWSNAVTIGKLTAFSSFQEFMSLDAASNTTGTTAVGRAIWKGYKSGMQIYASSYSQ